MIGSRYASNVTDEQWSIVEPLLPETNRRGRRRRINLRSVIDAMFYLLRTGCQWRQQDGVQALMLALRRVSDVLMDSEPYKAGALTLWGQHDLDLPPGWGAGALYTVPHPPASR
ncbi:transposase [Chelativorans sp. YIM 93263]|uniref:transposase n=1 Tax=Chelativorans sp. YIM 93263 TaxID=2906648 RepID=UPI002379968E|nr:transposase [Chelativorans sp. YIM 93263]